MILLNINNLINEVCTRYQIGRRTSDLHACVGGLLHQIYQFQTTTGQFIIKVLNPTIIQRPNIIDRYRITETIAKTCSKRTSVVTALTYQGDPLYCLQDQVIMLFPYISGKILEQNKISIEHIKKISEALALIHKADIQMPLAPPVELPSPCLSNLNIPNYLKLELKACMSLVDEIFKKCQQYKNILKSNTVISHRDCDPKNVLWDDNNQFYLIDWETAGLINKTKDVLGTALYWSFDENFNINRDYLRLFLNVYQQHNGHIHTFEVESGLYGFLGDWVSWLDFNLSRIINHPDGSDEFTLGLSQANNTLFALPKVLKQFPDIINDINKLY
jgi:thiamine kinase-like enzyme